MSVCRVCGIEIRAGDLVVERDDDRFHLGCTEAHKEPPRRKVGLWASMGSRGQMAMGDVQRDLR